MPDPSKSPSLRFSQAAGAAWALAAIGYVIGDLREWPFIWNGLTIARLNVFGAIVVLATGAFLLPHMWRAQNAVLPRYRALFLALRLTVFVSGLLVTLALALLVVNARSELKVALGMDEFSDGSVRLLSTREVEVQGSFRSGLTADLKHLLDTHPGVQLVHLNSRGGWLREGELMSRLIRERGLDTYSSTGCASACVEAFIAGKHRTLYKEARIGLHCGNIEGSDPLYVNRANDDLVARLVSSGASAAFAQRVRITPNSGVWYPDPPLLIDNHLLDAVSAGEGFAPSGEVLTWAAPQVKRLEAPMQPDVPSLRGYAPDLMWRLERSLALRVKNDETDEHGVHELLGHTARQIESRALSATQDSAELEYARIYLARAGLFESEPSQCATLLGPISIFHPAVPSEAALKEMYSADAALVRHVISDPHEPRVPTAGTVDQLLTRLPQPMATNLTGSNGRESQCSDLQELYRQILQLQDTQSAAAWVRAIRIKEQ